jgi:alpha-1,2-mannosyltransferase
MTMCRTPTILATCLFSFVAWLFWRRSIVPPDEGANSRALNVISGLATFAALFQLFRLCVFIVNPAAVGCAVSHSRGLGLPAKHSCLSAYYVAARSVATVPNVYAWELYSFPDVDPTAPRNPRPIGSFDIDAYEYPPPFLLLPRTLAILAPEFLPSVWSGLR